MLQLAPQHLNPESDISIAQKCQMQPIQKIASKLNIPHEYLYNYGPYKAKISLPYVKSLENNLPGKLILMTGISPTKAGEGKTTTTVGLGDALSKMGMKAAICLREPSLGPCFGIKGGAAGGGYAQVVPMEEINLHFTGDFHAIGAAHNLLAAMLDNHLYWGNELKIDVEKIVWRRAIDMNDRSLRAIQIGLEKDSKSIARNDGFEITVASEVMAIFCLALNLEDLQNRLGNILVAYSTDSKPIYARDLQAEGAMTALLKEAIQPNLVQTLEGTPAFIHGGPFANIAHGCNSVISTKTALKLADYVVTEAGFGADLGAEKFLDIKCRKANLKPDCVVIVATIRALKLHGGILTDELKTENTLALEKGFANLARHIENIRKFSLSVVVALNRFSSDTENERQLLKRLCESLEVKMINCDHWAQGSLGCLELAQEIINLTENKQSKFNFLYEDKLPLIEKVRYIAQTLYGAKDIFAEQKVLDNFKRLQENGYGHFPVCIAKTPMSFSTDPKNIGAPCNHIISIREVRLARGAEFIVVICGDVITMPGLPRNPSATRIRVNAEEKIEGLF